MIIKLHGTSGSGKTTAARDLMARADQELGTSEIMNISGKWPEAYMFKLPGVLLPVFVLGPYVSACGGLDCIPDVEDHMRLIEDASKHGHVFYESLLGSEYYGKIGQFTERWGDDHIFAFLDTPIETCVERVKARRRAAGNLKPLNEGNTRERVRKIERLKIRLIHELHRRVEVIDHTKAAEQLHNLLKGINGSHGT